MEAWGAVVGIGISKDVILEVTCDRAINAEIIYHTSGLAVGLYFHLTTACDPYVTTGEEICV